MSLLLLVGGFKESIKLRDYRSTVMDQWITEQSIHQKHIGDAKKKCYKQTSAFYFRSNKGKFWPPQHAASTYTARLTHVNIKEGFYNALRNSYPNYGFCSASAKFWSKWRIFMKLGMNCHTQYICTQIRQKKNRQLRCKILRNYLCVKTCYKFPPAQPSPWIHSL